MDPNNSLIDAQVYLSFFERSSVLNAIPISDAFLSYTLLGI